MKLSVAIQMDHVSTIDIDGDPMNDVPPAATPASWKAWTISAVLA